MGLWFLRKLYLSEIVCDGRRKRPATALGFRRNYGDAAVNRVEFCLFTVSLRGGVSNVLAYRHPNAVKAIAPFQVVRTLGVHFLFSIDEDAIWPDPAIGCENHWAVAKAAFGLHPFCEIDLPVHWGYLISVSPTVSQQVKYNKTKELAERVGFEPTLPFRVNTLSKRAPSATRPSLRRKLRKKKTCFGKAFDCRVSEARLLGLILILWVMGAPAQIGNAQKCRGSSSERPRVRKAFLARANGEWLKQRAHWTQPRSPKRLPLHHWVSQKQRHCPSR